jgi:hypothetical protein
VSYVGLSTVRAEKMGVMPFLTGRNPSNFKETLSCNLCNLVFDSDSVDVGASSALTRYVYEDLYDRFQDRVIPHDKMVPVYEGISKDPDRDTPLTLARRVGQALGANVMVLGTVWRYRDKGGSSASSRVSASVAFDVYVVDVRTGNMLWMANFDETQRALSDNVWDIDTFFSRGAKWLSANELAHYGVGEIVKQMPF